MKNLTKYIVFIIIFGMNACKKDEPVAPSIIGKWRQTGYSKIPLPSGTTQAQLDVEAVCNNTFLYEFTNTSVIISGADCKGHKEDSQINYSVTNGVMTLSTGSVYTVNVITSLLTLSLRETSGGITSTTKLTFTRQ